MPYPASKKKDCPFRQSKKISGERLATDKGHNQLYTMTKRTAEAQRDQRHGKDKLHKRRELNKT